MTESDQRVAAVTGGAGAIGGAVGDALSRAGYHVIRIDIRGGDVDADLASAEATQRASEEILNRYGRVDVLVHCAGVFEPMTVLNFDLERWRAVFAVNVESALLLTKAFAPGMIERGFGRIVLIASDSLWKTSPPEFLSYVSSKGSVVGAVRALASELGGHGIAVTAVAPGLTETPMSLRVNTGEQFDTVVAAQALKRRLAPTDVANVVAFLASEGAEALTGQVVLTNGGLVMH